MRSTETPATPKSGEKAVNCGIRLGGSGKSTCVLLLALALFGCQSTAEKPSQSAEANPPSASTEIETQPASSSLSTDLLYDILVASIAGQRNQAPTALEHLSRAAYQSRDRRLITSAMNLAMNMGEYTQALDLAELLQRVYPQSNSALLSIARARFGLGEAEQAYDLLIDLASDQTDHSTAVLQSIASLLEEHESDNPDILEDFLASANRRTLNEFTAMTAAILASRLNQQDKFLQLLDQTLELNPEWEFAGILKLTELSKKDFPSSRRYAREYLAQHPGFENFRLQYARILIQNDQANDSERQLETLLEQNPDSSDALFTTGALLLDQKRYQQARKALVRHLELNPENDQARIYLADIEHELGNLSEAAKYLYAVSSQYHYIDAQVKLAHIIAERNDVDTAVRHLQQIQTYSVNEKTRLILEQDLLLRDYDQPDKSIAILNDGLNRFPNHPDLLYNRGLLAAQMDMLEVHEQDMRKLILLQPGNAHAYNALGYTLADQTDRLDEALELITTANNLLPNNAFILDSMGWVHFRLGNTDQAIRYLRKALDQREDAEIAAHLGEVLWVSGRRDEAMKIWQKGVEWGPDNSVLKDTIDRFTNQSARSGFRAHALLDDVEKIRISI